jgi:hypothetical protein
MQDQNRIIEALSKENIELKTQIKILQNEINKQKVKSSVASSWAHLDEATKYQQEDELKKKVILSMNYIRAAKV